MLQILLCFLSLVNSIFKINRMSQNYLIVVGTNKAGTTSLFEYIIARPEVCGAFIKQTSFFFDKDYSKADLQVYYDYENPNHSFDDYFRNCTPQTVWKAEASPDYMYSKGTAKRISEYLKGNRVKIVFILRDPVTRFESLYRFGKQSGELDKKMSIDEFFEAQTEDESVRFWFNSLMTGNYSNYIQPYFEYFNKEDIIILFYEEMRDNPVAFMESLSSQIGLSSGFYEDFGFDRHNKTYSIKSKFLATYFLKIRNLVIRKTVLNKRLFSAVKTIAKYTVIPVYRLINFGTLKKEETPQTLRKTLKEYYKPEIIRMERLLGKKTPWS